MATIHAWVQVQITPMDHLCEILVDKSKNKLKKKGMMFVFFLVPRDATIYSVNHDKENFPLPFT